MAVLPFESTALNNHLVNPSISPLSSKFVLSNTNLRRSDQQLLQLFGFRAKTPHLSRSRRAPTRAVASLGGLLGGIFKGADNGESTRQRYASTVGVINRLEAEMKAMSDSELGDRTSLLKERARNGESLDSLLPVSFSTLIWQCFLFSCIFLDTVPNLLLLYHQTSCPLAGSICCCQGGFKKGSRPSSF